MSPEWNSMTTRGDIALIKVITISSIIIISAVKNVTAKSEFPVVSPILQILPVTGQIFQ